MRRVMMLLATMAVMVPLFAAVAYAAPSSVPMNARFYSTAP